jgi:Protein of unknown function (DUF4038)/Putative collagen-binding domain of a collagenase
MKKSCLNWIVLLGIFVVPHSAVLRADDLGNLHVSENGRFLVRDDGSGIFPVADTAWAIAWKLDRGQAEAYLQHRKEQHFNMIALVAFPSDGEVTDNAYGDRAFEVHGGRYDPLRPITTPGSRPADSTEYDYWDHLEYIIDASAAKGLYVVLLPAWGNYVAGGYGNGKNTSGIILRLDESYRYGRWLGQRFKGKKNILWMMGGDRSAVYGDKDYRNVFRAIAEGIADGVNGINQQDGKADFSSTLMSYHPQKWAPNSSEWFHDDPWLDFNSIQDQPKDQVAAIELDYGLAPVKPTWLFEGGYEHRGNDVYQDWQIRFQSYQTVFAGGFGVTYGNMNIYHFSDKEPRQDESVKTHQAGTWEHSLDDPGAEQMRHLSALMTSLSNDQFLDRIPDQSLIEGDQGSMDGPEGDRSSLLQATRGGGGDYAMVYSANGRDISVRMNRLAAGRMNAFWFNPRNGKWRVKDSEVTDPRPFEEDIPSGPAAPTRKFDPTGPVGDGNDWVLVLKAVQ